MIRGMIRSTIVAICTACAGLTFMSTSAQAALVDINRGASPNLSGALAFGLADSDTGPHSASQAFTGTDVGNFTMTISAHANWTLPNTNDGMWLSDAASTLRPRNRTSGTSFGAGTTYGPLYQDFVFGINHVMVSLSGLSPSTQYDVRLFTYDGSAAGWMTAYAFDMTSAVTNQTGSKTAGLGSLLTSSHPSANGSGGLDIGASPAATWPIDTNNEGSFYGRVTTNAAGELWFRMSAQSQTSTFSTPLVTQYLDLNQSGRISGLEITAVPEPAVLGLASVVGAALMLRRRSA